jgi:hypothetical protein
MIALASSIVHRNDKRLEEYFKLAVENYVQVGDYGRGARAALWAAEVFKSTRTSVAAPLLISVAENEQNSYSAVLYEQAALVYLNSRPKYIRKYAFYNLIAARVFQKFNCVILFYSRFHYLFIVATSIC